MGPYKKDAGFLYIGPILVHVPTYSVWILVLTASEILSFPIPEAQLNQALNFDNRSPKP